jgi:hypothetical protein
VVAAAVSTASGVPVQAHKSKAVAEQAGRHVDYLTNHVDVHLGALPALLPFRFARY